MDSITIVFFCKVKAMLNRNRVQVLTTDTIYVRTYILRHPVKIWVILYFSILSLLDFGRLSLHFMIFLHPMNYAHLTDFFLFNFLFRPSLLVLHLQSSLFGSLVLSVHFFIFLKLTFFDTLRSSTLFKIRCATTIALRLLKISLMFSFSFL